MATKTIHAYTLAVTIDATADLLLIDPGSTGIYKSISRNVLLGITGAPVGTTDTQAISNKTYGNTNTITLKGSLFTLQDQTDTTKQGNFSLAGVTTATTRTWTLPNGNLTLATTSGTETFTNKTITSPTITGGTITNPTLTIDSINEFTALNGVTVAGLSLKSGKLNTASSVVATNITAGAIQPNGLTSGTGTGWAWSAWTPTWSNLTVGNGTVTARYIQVGKTVFFRLYIVFGNTSAVTGDVQFSPPVAPTTYALSGAAFNVVGRARFDITSAFMGIVDIVDTTHFRVLVEKVDATYNLITSLTSLIPATWTTGSVMQIQGVYEAL